MRKQVICLADMFCLCLRESVFSLLGLDGPEMDTLGISVEWVNGAKNPLS